MAAEPKSTNGTRPDPDPTRLTMEAQERAIAGIKELFEAKHSFQQAAIERLQAEIEKRPGVIAAEIAHLKELLSAEVACLANVREAYAKQLYDQVQEIKRSIEQGPIAIKMEVRALHELITGEMRRIEDVTDGRFDATNNRFTERDMRATALANERDIRANALAAAGKEAITKSEVSVTEKINGLQTIFDRTNQARDGQINDLKTRLDKGEGNNPREKDNMIADLKTRLDLAAGGKQGLVDMRAWLVAAVSIIGGIVGIAITVLALK